MSKESIISNILSTANTEAETILAEAREKASALQQDDLAFAEATMCEAEEKAKREELLAIERAKSVAALDVKKLLLKAKQDKIAEVFEKAEKAFIDMDEKKYNDFIISMLEKYLEKGDEVVFAKADENRVGKAVKFIKEKGNSYRMDGAFSAGVVLENKSADKNLTVASLLGEYRETSEIKIASMLQGE